MLRYKIAFDTQGACTFRKVHRFISLDRFPRPLGRTKTKARLDPLFDASMILLDDVVQEGAVRQRHRRPSSPDCCKSVTALAQGEGIPFAKLANLELPPAGSFLIYDHATRAIYWFADPRHGLTQAVSCRRFCAATPVPPEEHNDRRE